MQAKALLHVGLCYEKLGREEATKAYQRLVDNYPAQKGEVAIARERLSHLIVIAENPSLQNEKEEVTIRKFMDGTGAGLVMGNPSPSGKYFAYVDWSTSPNDVVIKEIKSGVEIRLRNQIDLNVEGDEGTPYNPIWSPDSKQIAYVWESDKDNLYELRIVEVDNPKPEALITVSYDKGWIKTEDWSPDGQHILVQVHQDDKDHLGLISTRDSSFHLLKTVERSAPFSAKFSYDGQFIAYDNPPDEESNDHDIYVLSIDGERETKVTSHPSHDYLLDWVPGELKVLFASDRNGTNDMWSTSVDNRNDYVKPTLITENIGNIGPLGSDRSGSFYYSTPGSWWDIYTVHLDPETGEITIPPSEIQLPNQGYNRHATWSPDGEYLAYVSVKRHLRQPNILCIYDKKTGSIKEYAFQKDVKYPVWFPNSQSIMLFGSDELDIATGTITPFVKLDRKEEMYNIRISPDSKTIYYATRNKDWDQHSIFERKLETGEETEIYSTMDINLTISLSPDGQQMAVLVRHNENTRILKLISTADHSEKVLHTYQQDNFGYGSTTWHPNGKYIYFSKIVDDTWELCRIPSAGGEAENLRVKKRLFTGLSFNPDGSELTFSSFVGMEKPGGVWVMENHLSLERLAQNEEAKALTYQLTNKKIWNEPDTELGGAPSPDGKYLSYVDWETGDLAIYEIATGIKRRVTNKGSWEESDEFALRSRWSPEGKQIVYDWHNGHDHCDLRIIELEGSKPRILHRDKDVKWIYTCGWSPDGKQILAYFDRKNGNHMIGQMVLVSTSDGAVKVLKTSAITEIGATGPGNMCFSPEGHYIFYDLPQKTGSPERDIFMMSSDGTYEIPLVEHPSHDVMLGCAPDGKNILFSSDRNGTFSLWRKQIIGGKPQGNAVLIHSNMGSLKPLGITQKGSFYYGYDQKNNYMYGAELDPENRQSASRSKKNNFTFRRI